MPDEPASASLARCKVCKDLMVLLLQLNGELPERFPGHERRLYIFACRRKTCRRRDGTIRAIRGLRVDPAAAKAPAAAEAAKKEDKKAAAPAPPPPSNLGDTLFGAKTMGSSAPANPFATSSTSTSAAPANPFSTAPKKSEPEPAAEPKAAETATKEADETLPKSFAETLNINNNQASSAAAAAPPKEPWPAATERPKPYALSYLVDAEYETLDATPPPVTQATETSAPQMEVDAVGSGSGGGGGKEDRDVFESTMDAAFQRFADRLVQNPEQVIRYEYAGIPLLYSRTDALGKLLSPPSSASSGAGGGGMPSITTVTSTAGGAGEMRSRIPRCANCGGTREFEVQMTPYAIEELEGEEGFSSLEEGMDWGTIILAVCGRDCLAPGVGSGDGEAGYLEEWVGVQWEEVGGSGGGKRG